MSILLQKIIQLFKTVFSITTAADQEDTVGTEQVGIDMQLIYAQFPYAKKEDIDLNYPLLVKALNKHGIFSREMLIYALATVSVEVPKFKPVKEIPSKYSTKNKLKPYDFSGYVGRMGNKDLEMATKYSGKGLIQLTGYNNYCDLDKKLLLNGELVQNPDLALDAKISAEVLAIYFKDRIDRVKQALINKDFAELRKIVNGGFHGLDKFVAKFKELDQVFPK
jgi:hypothetical protein